MKRKLHANLLTFAVIVQIRYVISAISFWDIHPEDRWSRRRPCIDRTIAIIISTLAIPDKRPPTINCNAVRRLIVFFEVPLLQVMVLARIAIVDPDFERRVIILVMRCATVSSRYQGPTSGKISSENIISSYRYLYICTYKRSSKCLHWKVGTGKKRGDTSEGLENMHCGSRIIL
jgi:hypothetical protein